MAPQWASDELVRAVGSAAAEPDAGIHLHALESRLQRAWGDAFADAGELQRLVDAQVLTDRSALAHGVWLRDSDVELLARAGSDGRAQLRLQPAPRRGHRTAAPARRLAVSASRWDSTTWASPTTTTCSRRCDSRTSCSACAASRSTRACEAAEVFGLMWDGGARVVGAATPSADSSPGGAATSRCSTCRALSAPYRRRRRRRLGAAASAAARRRTSTP